jgi:hypothetical protein
LPYAWLQRSRVYIYLAVGVSAGAYIIQIILPVNEFTVILFYVALLYWVGAIVVNGKAARLVAASNEQKCHLPNHSMGHLDLDDPISTHLPNALTRKLH